MANAVKRKRISRGFTLVEVMLGIMLSAMAVATLSTLIPLATKGQQASREYLQMTDVSQAKMDRLKDLGYGRLTAEEIVAANIGTVQSENVYQFSLTKDVNSVVSAVGTITISDYSADIKRVAISITWSASGSQGSQRNYEVQGLIARQ